MKKRRSTWIFKLLIGAVSLVVLRMCIIHNPDFFHKVSDFSREMLGHRMYR